MAGGFLPLPRDFKSDPIYQNPAWLGAYTRLQMEAAWKTRSVAQGSDTVTLDPGQVLFSQRDFAEELGWKRHEARTFIGHLEERSLVSYPDGKTRGKPYRMRLSDCWYLRRKESAQLPPNFSPNSQSRKSKRNKGDSESSSENPPNSTPESRPPSAQLPPESRPTSERSSEPSESNNGGGPPESGSAVQEGESAQLSEGAYRSSRKGEETPSVSPPSEEEEDPTLETAYELLVKIGLRGHEPVGKGKAKQRAKLKQLIQDHGIRATVDAIKGARHCFPYNEESRPFDAFNVEKRLDVYVAAWHTRKEVRQKKQVDREKAEQHRQEVQEELAEQERRREEWWKDLDERFRGESDELKSRIRNSVTKQLSRRNLSNQTREALATSMIRQQYAKEKGLKPPGRSNGE